MAVFLFFLSVALVWTNRQDIALSLSMEHKMKAEAAARSGAMSVYGVLRATGRPPATLEKSLESGADWRVQLVRLRPEGLRGNVLLVRSRGTSGPVSSYVTLHLLESELSTDSSQSKDRLLIFPKIQSSDSEDSEIGEETTEVSLPSGEATGATRANSNRRSSSNDGTAATASTTAVLPPDFTVQQAPLNLPSPGYVAAQDGPIFASEKVSTTGQTSALSVVETIPVFSSTGSAPLSFGPALLEVKAPSDQTQLRVLRKRGDTYEWESIESPAEMESQDGTVSTAAPVGRVDITAAGTSWKGLTVRAIDGKGTVISWTAPGFDQGTVLNSFEAEGTQEWSNGSSKPIRSVVLRGNIASQGETVYSHGWQYMYLRYSGAAVMPPLPVETGSRILRAPCVVKYDASGKSWETVWSPLKDNGDLATEEVPNPEKLWVDSEGQAYSVNSLNELLRLNPNGSVTKKGLVADGRLVFYNGKAYTTSTDAKQPGLSSPDGGAPIDFSTLPRRIPLVSGPIMPIPPAQIPGYDLSKLEVSELPDGTATEIRTVVPQYNFTYRISSASGLAASGEDLYANLQISCDRVEPETDPFGDFELGTLPASVLARYDGKRWHILPNGLLAALGQSSSSLASPGDNILCATYGGLPERGNRYSVISISSDPFEFQE